MTEQADLTKDTSSELEEMRLLKERAELMGVKFHPSIKIETLRQKVKDALEGKKPSKKDEAEAQAQALWKNQKNVTLDVDETDQELRTRIQRDALRLRRCKIYNLNPSKNDLRGEIITVASGLIGTIRKFIPFGETTDNGYHIPNVIYEDLKSRQFQMLSIKKVDGKEEIVRRLAPEYNIVLLPDLTAEQLEELRIRQAATKSISAA